MQFQGKLMNQTAKNLIFDLFWPKYGPQKFYVGSISSQCYTLLQVIIVCNFKEN